MNTANRAPGGLRAIGDDRDLLAHHGVHKCGLAHIGAPRQRHEATAGHRLARAGEQLVLQREHLAVVDLVIHAEQVQHPVDDRLAHIGGVLGADHDVAELARLPTRPHRGRRGSVDAVDREGEHIRRLPLAAVLEVELGDALGVDELDRNMAVADAEALLR